MGLRKVTRGGWGVERGRKRCGRSRTFDDTGWVRRRSARRSLMASVRSPFSQAQAVFFTNDLGVEAHSRSTWPTTQKLTRRHSVGIGIHYTSDHGYRNQALEKHDSGKHQKNHTDLRKRMVSWDLRLKVGRRSGTRCISTSSRDPLHFVHWESWYDPESIRVRPSKIFHPGRFMQNKILTDCRPSHVRETSSKETGIC